MRRIGIVLVTVVGLLAVAAPASAFAHDRVRSPLLHAVLDGLTLLAVSAPLWTAMLWGPRRRGLLLGFVAVVQAPVAVVGFVPIVDPVLHVSSVAVALLLTAFSIVYVRRAVPAVAPARSPSSP